MCCRHKKVNLKEWQTKDIIHFASPLHFSSPLYIQWVSLLFLMRLSFLFSNYSYTFFNLNIFPSSLPSFSPPSSISDCSFYSFLSCLLSLCLFTFLFLSFFISLFCFPYIFFSSYCSLFFLPVFCPVPLNPFITPPPSPPTTPLSLSHLSSYSVFILFVIISPWQQHFFLSKQQV